MARRSNQSILKEINSEFIGKTDAEAETLVLWPPNGMTWLIRKDSDAGKDWRQEEMTEDEIVGCHHQLDGHEFEHALGVDDGQGNLVCCSPWGHKQLDMAEWLNNNNNQWWLAGILKEDGTSQGHHVCPPQFRAPNVQDLGCGPGICILPSAALQPDERMYSIGLLGMDMSPLHWHTGGSHTIEMWDSGTFCFWN